MLKEVLPEVLEVLQEGSVQQKHATRLLALPNENKPVTRCCWVTGL